MKAVIIEDEAIAAKMLQEKLHRLKPEMAIIAVLQTIDESVEWLTENPMPDVLFMDIHLGDGSSFTIFDRVRISCPVIFTTSYDEYALRAFEVNCVDYLLKPIEDKDLQRALGKIERILQEPKHTAQAEQATLIENLLKTLRGGEQTYPRSLLIPQRDGLFPLDVSQIAFVMSEMKMAKIYTLQGKSYVLDMSLEQLSTQLSPRQFFRANRQFIVAHDAIQNISFWFTGKLALNMVVPTPERIIVSRQTANDFKQWYTETTFRNYSA